MRAQVICHILFHPIMLQFDFTPLSWAASFSRVCGQTQFLYAHCCCRWLSAEWVQMNKKLRGKVILKNQQQLTGVNGYARHVAVSLHLPCVCSIERLDASLTSRVRVLHIDRSWNSLSGWYINGKRIKNDAVFFMGESKIRKCCICCSFFAYNSLLLL